MDPITFRSIPPANESYLSAMLIFLFLRLISPVGLHNIELKGWGIIESMLDANTIKGKY